MVGKQLPPHSRVINTVLSRSFIVCEAGSARICDTAFTNSEFVHKVKRTPFRGPTGFRAWICDTASTSSELVHKVKRTTFRGPTAEAAEESSFKIK